MDEIDSDFVIVDLHVGMHIVKTEVNRSDHIDTYRTTGTVTVCVEFHCSFDF